MQIDTSNRDGCQKKIVEKKHPLSAIEKSINKKRHKDHSDLNIIPERMKHYSRDDDINQKKLKISNNIIMDT